MAPRGGPSAGTSLRRDTLEDHARTGNRRNDHHGPDALPLLLVPLLAPVARRLAADDTAPPRPRALRGRRAPGEGVVAVAHGGLRERRRGDVHRNPVGPWRLRHGALRRSHGPAPRPDHDCGSPVRSQRSSGPRLGRAGRSVAPPGRRLH